MLSGKTAIITGGSRGIGLKIAQTMANNGANIAILSRNFNYDFVDEFKKSISQDVIVKVYPCDVSDFENSKKVVDMIIEDFGHIDILVNNAGIVKDKLLLAMKEDDFDSVINVNLKGTFNMIKHTFSHFAKRRSGRIINITSVSALLGTAGQANYVSSKAAIIGLTK